jgi:tetratricopeptide (TPR) repeat protein
VNVDSLKDEAQKFLNSGSFEEALSCVDQALFLEKSNPDILNLKGVILRALGRYSEALECFNESLEIDPRDRNSS